VRGKRDRREGMDANADGGGGGGGGGGGSSLRKPGTPREEKANKKKKLSGLVLCCSMQIYRKIRGGLSTTGSVHPPNKQRPEFTQEYRAHNM